MPDQDVIAEAFYGGQWRALPLYSDEADHGQAITIGHGQGDEQDDPTPAYCNLTVDNRSGIYNPRNPTSPLYGKAGRNTPLRVALRHHLTSGPLVDARDLFGRTAASSWGSADVGGAWSLLTAGGGSSSWFSVSTGQGRHNVVNATAYALSYLTQVSAADVDVAVTVTAPQATGASLEPANIALRGTGTTAYVLARVEVTTANAVRLHVFDASSVLLGSVTVAGLVHAGSGTPLRVRARAVASNIMVKVWQAAGTEPADWQLTVTDPEGPIPGWVGVRSGRATGNTNTSGPQFGYDDFAVTVEDTRFTGEVARWSPQHTEEFTVGGGRGDAWTAIAAAGVLRRLGVGNDARSALVRLVVDGSLAGSGPLVYWPMEDGQDAQWAASAVPNGPQLWIASGVIDFEESLELPGSAGFAQVSEQPAGVLSAMLPAYADTLAGWQAFIWARATGTYAGGTPGASYDELQVMGLDTTTGYRLLFGLSNNFGGGVNPAYVSVRDSSDTFVGGVVDSSEPDLPGYLGGDWHLMHLVVDQLTATTSDVRLYVDGQLRGTWLSSPLSGVPSRVRTLDNIGFVETTDVAVAHIGVVPNDVLPSPAELYDAGWGHPGETATQRIARLARERGVGLALTGDTTESQVMGPQYPDSTFGLLAETARTDAGILSDARNLLGLAYRPGRSLYGQSPALTLDYASGALVPPFTPALDDQRARNDVTVNRREGARGVRAVQLTGPLNVNDPTDDPDGIGRVATQYDLNPASDTDLPDHATWRLHLGTVDDLRFAVVVVDLDAAPGLVEAVAGLRIGDMIAIANLPAHVSPDTARLITPGYVETIYAARRTLAFNLIPAAAWDVGTYDEPAAPTSTRWDFRDTVTVGQITAGVSTSVQIATASGTLMTTDPAQFPIDLDLAGARVRATACSGATSPQTVTISASVVNGVAKVIPAGEPVRLWQPTYYGL